MKPTSDGIELRIVVPRDSLPSAPAVEYYSQVNCELLGLDKRRFLELLRRDGAPPTKKRGKLRLVRRDLMLAYMERLDDTAPEVVVERDGADEVLLEMGYAPTTRRKAG